MGACASKFPLLKNAADAPPPADLPSKEVNPREEVVAVKNDATVADDESKPQSLGHLFKEKEGEKKAEDGKKKVEDREIVEMDAKREEVETLKREEGKAVEICEADKKPESPETKKNDEKKPTADVEKKGEKPAEIIGLGTGEVYAEKKKEEEKPTEVVKIETSEKAPGTPVNIAKTEEQIPAKDSGEKKAAKPTDNIKIETSDKHVLEPSKPEKPSDKKPDEKSVEKHEIPPASDAEKPKTEEKTQK